MHFKSPFFYVWQNLSIYCRAKVSFCLFSLHKDQFDNQNSFNNFYNLKYVCLKSLISFVTKLKLTTDEDKILIDRIEMFGLDFITISS